MFDSEAGFNVRQCHRLFPSSNKLDWKVAAEASTFLCPATFLDGSVVLRLVSVLLPLALYGCT